MSSADLPTNRKVTNFEDFRTNTAVKRLRFPDDVVEQWLYGHGENTPFLRDHGGVDLSKVTWDVEAV